MSEFNEKISNRKVHIPDITVAVQNSKITATFWDMNKIEICMTTNIDDLSSN